jgi:hypothetical protein
VVVVLIWVLTGLQPWGDRCDVISALPTFTHVDLPLLRFVTLLDRATS